MTTKELAESLGIPAHRVAGYAKNLSRLGMAEKVNGRWIFRPEARGWIWEREHQRTTRPNGSKTASFSISVESLKMLEEFAKKAGQSKSSIVDEAIRALLTKNY